MSEQEKKVIPSRTKEANARYLQATRNKYKENGKKQIQMYVEADLYELIAAKSQNEGIPIATLCKQILREALTA